MAPQASRGPSCPRRSARGPPNSCGWRTALRSPRSPARSQRSSSAHAGGSRPAGRWPGPPPPAPRGWRSPSPIPLLAPASIPWLRRGDPGLAPLRGRARACCGVGRPRGRALLARAAPRAEGGRVDRARARDGPLPHLRGRRRPGHRAGADRRPGRPRNPRGHGGVRRGRGRAAVRRERHPRRAATASLRSHRDVADPRRERPRPVRPGGRGRRHLPHGVRGALRALRRRPFPGRHRSCGRRRRGDGVHRAGPRPRSRRDGPAGPQGLRRRSQAPRSVPGAGSLAPARRRRGPAEEASEALGSASVVRAGAWLAASGAVLAAGRSAPRRLAAAASAALCDPPSPQRRPGPAIPWDRFPRRPR